MHAIDIVYIISNLRGVASALFGAGLADVMPGHDPRRPERVQRYQPGKQTDVGSPAEHINALGMVCSLLGLLMRVRVTCMARLY